MAQTCRVTPPEALAYAPLPDGGGHPTTSGAPTETAMRALLESDDDAMVAFCLLYLDDYVWGGYELPRACARSDEVRRLTTPYDCEGASPEESEGETSETRETAPVDVAANEGETERPPGAAAPKQSFAEAVRSRFSSSAAPRETAEDDDALPIIL